MAGIHDRSNNSSSPLNSPSTSPTCEQQSTIPIILMIGPPGSGKGTLSTRLASDFNLHHLSFGDWLRSQTAPPITGVPAHLNAYVSEGLTIPTEALKAEYGNADDAPPALVLYNCSKRGVSTPESMKVRAMPALREHIDAIAAQATADSGSGSGRPKAILLDNLPQILAHAEAAATVFGSDFPALTIAVDCTDSTAEARFLARARGDDDAAKFRRRIARFRRGYPDVRAFYEGTAGSVVGVGAEGEPDSVYDGLIGELDKCERWQAIIGAGEEEESVPSPVLVEGAFFKEEMAPSPTLSERGFCILSEGIAT